MKSLRTALSLLAISALATSMAWAQATRTWVSGVGDDANPCSRTAPCKTFAGAISKTAAGGEIDALDPGGFGGLTITKAITIDGGGGQVASILVAGTNGITVAAGATDVVILRNLRLQGIAQSGFGGLNGIQLNSAGALHIEHCAIMNFAQNGISIGGSGGGNVVIDDTTSEGNQGDGLNMSAITIAVRVSVINSHFLHNKNGVNAVSNVLITVLSSEAAGNSAGGFVATGLTEGIQMNLVSSTATNNSGVGVTAGGGAVQAIVRLSNMSIVTNGSASSLLTNGKFETYSNNSIDALLATSSKIGLQ